MSRELRRNIGIKKTKLIILFQFVTIAAGFIATSSYFTSIANRRGVVKGILYTMDNNSTAQIDNQIVRVGETINGVKIINIEQFHVEFQRGQYSWRQKVRQRPDPVWNTEVNYQSGTVQAADTP